MSRPRSGNAQLERIRVRIPGQWVIRDRSGTTVRNPGLFRTFRETGTVGNYIDIRVEGLETDSINTASRADSSMLLLLRPLHSSMKLRVADQTYWPSFPSKQCEKERKSDHNSPTPPL